MTGDTEAGQGQAGAGDASGVSIPHSTAVRFSGRGVPRSIAGNVTVESLLSDGPDDPLALYDDGDKGGVRGVTPVQPGKHGGHPENFCAEKSTNPGHAGQPTPRQSRIPYPPPPRSVSHAGRGSIDKRPRWTRIE